MHFEWVLRTLEQRVMKLRRYDRHHYGYGVFFETVYLPERVPEGAIRFAPLDEPGFADLAEAYYAARDNRVRITRRSIADHTSRLHHRIGTLLVPPRLDVEPEDRKGLAPRPEDEVPLSPPGRAGIA